MALPTKLSDNSSITTSSTGHITEHKSINKYLRDLYDYLQTELLPKIVLKDTNNLIPRDLLPTLSFKDTQFEQDVEGVISIKQSALSINNLDKSLELLNILGSTIKAQSILCRYPEISTNINLTSGQFRLVPILVDTPFLASGVTVYISVQGDYTANNENSLTLYKVETDKTLTQVANTGNIAALWKGKGYVTTPFTTSYQLSKGLYFVGILYSNSAQVKAPGLGASANGHNDNTLDITSTSIPGTTIKLLPSIFSQTTSPTTVSLTGSGVTNKIFVGLNQ